MAKIRIKFGENEVEIDSRDFYVDNQTIGEVIDGVTKHIQENKARMIFDDRSLDKLEQMTDNYKSNLDSLDALDDAEAYEPEFNEPVQIPMSEIKEKINFLASKSFFDTNRTVTETVEQLREYGWGASPLDVSTVLAKMAFTGEILKVTQDNRAHYFLKQALLAN